MIDNKDKAEQELRQALREYAEMLVEDIKAGRLKSFAEIS